MENQNFSFTQSGSYGTLVYTMQPGEELSQFDDGMLMNNNINGILSYVEEQNGLQKLLSYNILRGTRLSILRQKMLGKQAVISILSGIARVLIAAEEYMLPEDHFVFDDDCIFVDMNTYAVYLVYVPTNMYQGQPFAQYVKNFIFNGSFNPNEDTSVFMGVVSLINSNPNVSAEEIKAALERTPSQQSAPHVQPQAPVQQPVQSKAPVQQQPRVQQAPPVNTAPRPVQPASAPAAPAAQPASANNNAKKSGFLSNMFGGHKQKSEPAPSGVMAGMNVPSPAQQAPSQQAGVMAGLNIPGMAQQPAQKAPASASAKLPKQPKPSKKVPAPASPAAAAPVSVPAAAASVSVPAAAAAPVKPAPQQPVYSAPISPAPAAAMEDSGETVLLSMGGASDNSVKTPYLVSSRGDRIPITRNGFTVGKENKSGIANDYTVKNPGVSRNHAMFELKDGSVYIVDMTSLNGTFVNGKRISGNVEVEIHNGDIIVFADEKFEFIIE